MAEHRAVLLDTSVVIEPPPDLEQVTERAAVSTITLAELAGGLGTSSDPVERAIRQQRFETALHTYSPIGYNASAARLYGALCDAVRGIGRTPRPRRIDLMIASVAGDLRIPLLTRNPEDFRGIHEVVRVVEVGG